MHDIRKSYGWTDEQIIDHVETYGLENLLDMWKFIREDETYYYKMLLNMIPLARTPMDKKGASSMRDAEKKLEKYLDSLTPWKHRASRLGALYGKIPEGKTTVILESGDSPDNPLFANANIQKAKK